MEEGEKIEKLVINLRAAPKYLHTSCRITSLPHLTVHNAELLSFSPLPATPTKWLTPCSSRRSGFSSWLAPPNPKTGKDDEEKGKRQTDVPLVTLIQI